MEEKTLEEYMESLGIYDFPEHWDLENMEFIDGIPFDYIHR